MYLINAMRFFAAMLVLGVLSVGSASAAVVFRGSASGINTGLPLNGTAGALTIAKPATAKPGMVMIVSIAARPSGMTWNAPAGGGWTQLSVTSEQPGGGVSTAPGGMTLRTYYRVVGLSEPSSYTWTLANPAGTGGTAVGGMLVFSGIDTANNPINGTPTSVITTAYGTIFTTAPVTTSVPNAMMISVLSVLSADKFNPPTLTGSTACTGTGAPPITDVLDVSSPTAANPTGTTVDMAYFTQATAGVSCATRATIVTANSQDYGVGHLMALRPSLRDLTLDMVRDVPLSAGGTAGYTLTVVNDGAASEPGPLAIVDTLPAGLTYTGFTGAGWACLAAGQSVTCTKSGALAVGASAVPLVIKVSVAAGLSGVITNSAVVSGTGGDGNSANDTATDSFAILPTPYAYYAMDEANGTASFANTAATTSAPALALGATKATGNPPVVIAQALAGSPGTCGLASTPNGAGNGVNTNINVNAIGPNAGSIGFWYAGSTAWNDGSARMLFDGSVDGGAAADRYFFLAKDGTGKLVFQLKDSAGVTSTAISPSYNFGANSWHHIVVTWDLAASRLFIYLDGDTAPVASSLTTLGPTLANLNTLYMGAPQGGQITGAAAGYSALNANGYLDEVRIYVRALAPLEAASVSALVHACVGTVDHYELIVPATASACTPLPAVQVYACANAATGASCSGSLQAAVNGKTVGLAASAGTLGTTSPAFDAIGQANTTLNFPTGGVSTVTLSIGTTANPAPAALSAARCCVGGASCTTSNSCSTTITACSIAASNFGIVDSYYAAGSYDAAPDHRIYTKLAGWNEGTNALDNAASTFKLDVVALKSATATETSYVGAGTTKNVKMELFDDSAAGAACNSSAAACAACSKPVVATISPITFAPGDAGYSNDVPIAIGNTKAYSRLLARITDSNPTPAVQSCSSDVFAVRPSSVLLSTSALDTATPLTKAGQAFTLTAATTYGANYNGTLTLDTSKLSAQDPTQAPGIGGGAVGVLSPSTLIANLPATNASYSEVGYLYLAPGAYRDKNFTAVDQPGDCTDNSASTVKSGGRYGCWIESATPTGKDVSLGRFIPDHFITTLTPGNGTFTYSGQPFTTVTVTAVNASGGVTTNYRANLASPVTLSDANSASNSSATLGVLSGTGVPATAFAAGVATLSGTVSYAFNSALTAPLEVRTGSAPLQLRAVSTDAVSSAGYETGAITPVLSGRVRINNAYGSAQLPLALAASAQYYTGTMWITNTLDTGASGTRLLGAPTITTSGISTVATCPALACGATTGFTAGLLDLRLSASNAPGYADVLLNVPSWLRYPWKTAGVPISPLGRGTLGIYKGQNRIIYRRERY